MTSETLLLLSDISESKSCLQSLFLISLDFFSIVKGPLVASGSCKYHSLYNLLMVKVKEQETTLTNFEEHVWHWGLWGYATILANLLILHFPRVQHLPSFSLSSHCLSLTVVFLASIDNPEILPQTFSTNWRKVKFKWFKSRGGWKLVNWPTCLACHVSCNNMKELPFFVEFHYL